MLNNIIVITTTILMIILLFSKNIRTSNIWRATATPLASIIGSGFLVSAPLLILTTGQYAYLTMLIIVILAYFVGSSLRFNILYSEPLINDSKYSNSIPGLLEKFSTPILGVAYVISVAFYLKLLSAFALRGVGFGSLYMENILTTTLLLFIGLTGKKKGLSILESLETYSVNIKLSIIVSLIIGHIIFNFDQLYHGSWHLNVYPHDTLIPTFRKILGTLIIIQGFETSRYLGHAYPAQLRIKTMKMAQIISGCIYFIFILSTLTAFNNVHSLGETTVIDVCRMIAPALPFLLIVAAGMSQFSAAVADTIGSGGLLTEAVQDKISVNSSYLVITSIGVLLTWATNIYSIISIASKAFALYYAFQIGITICILIKQKNKTKLIFQVFMYTSLLILMLLVVFLGIPIE